MTRMVQILTDCVLLIKEVQSKATLRAGFISKRGWGDSMEQYCGRGLVLHFSSTPKIILDFFQLGCKINPKGLPQSPSIPPR